jgi:CubicO group peptidase (beta-lactamase class C family)
MVLLLGACAVPPSTAVEHGASRESPFLQDTRELEAFFQTQMATAHVPGLAVALVKDGRVRWARGYGFAQLPSRPVTKDTVFRIASISKTVVAAALMQLIEQPSRSLSLDQDIQRSLPFAVRNPAFRETPITFRMLLTHTSSIVDGSGDFSDVPGADATMPLGEWVRAYLERSDSWGNYAPGAKYSYSNGAASLAGYLVEAISGQSLQEYCRKNLFTPLGMNETSWFLRDFAQAHLAVPYEFASGTLRPIEHYGEAFYPAGQLRTSVTQLARFLAMIAGKGRLGPARVLQPATIDEMLRPQIPAVDTDQRIVFSTFIEPKRGHPFVGHTGAYRGCSSEMWLDLVSGAGYVLLTNGDIYLHGSKDPAAAAAMNAINAKIIDLSMELD